MAVGGNFPGIYDVNKITALADGPRSMYIDWIRIYQRGDAGESFVCPSASDAIEPEGTTAVQTLSTAVPAAKVMRDGVIYLMRDGVAYDVLGTRVQ